ncbi:MAG: response regulator receiver protein [Verrucomicrobiales bacterium]|nr:response regulator receiver protein [Verrucomicrobiales bacterium]
MRHFDVVLTDLIMPEIEGLELISELRRVNPVVKIFATYSGGSVNPQGYLKPAKHFGATRPLAKPFSGDELFAAIMSVLQD